MDKVIHANSFGKRIKIIMANVKIESIGIISNFDNRAISINK